MAETLKRDEQFMPAGTPDKLTAHSGLTVQLGLSHLLASAVALSLSFWLAYLHVQQLYTLLLALVAASLFGLCCTLNLQYNLSLLRLRLTHLDQWQLSAETRQYQEPGSVARRWPLGALFLSMQKIEVRMQQYATHALLTSDLREKALQQAREAAALAERNRIARELHDSIKQQIFSMSISAAAAKAHWQANNTSDACEAVEDIQRNAKEVQGEMQALFQQLRPAPLENTSLVEALRVQAQALSFRTGAQIHVDLAVLPQHDRLLPGTPEAIFRMVQEAFANIAKHARAHTIWLTLYVQEQSLHIEVRDDGQGFDTTQARKSMGLNNLHERAQELHGRAEISSQPGQGTTITINIPLLAALCSPEEEARQRYELARSEELSKRGYQLCTNTSALNLALIIMGFLAFPNLLWSIVICGMLVPAGYGYARGVYYRTRIVLSLGQESRTALELARQQYRSLIESMSMLGLSAFYLLYLSKILYTFYGQWLLFGLIICIAGLSVFARWRHYHNLERYYDLFQSQEVHWEMERRKQRLIRSLSIWSIISIIILLSSSSLFVLRPYIAAQRDIYDIVAIALILGVTSFSEYFYIRRYQQRLHQREQELLARAKEEEYV